MSFAPLGRGEQQQRAEELFQQVGGRGRSALPGWGALGRCGSARGQLSVSEADGDGRPRERDELGAVGTRRPYTPPVGSLLKR